jgi:hypothetical protein
MDRRCLETLVASRGANPGQTHVTRSRNAVASGVKNQTYSLREAMLENIEHHFPWIPTTMAGAAPRVVPLRESSENTATASRGCDWLVICNVAVGGAHGRSSIDHCQQSLGQQIVEIGQSV